MITIMIDRGGVIVGTLSGADFITMTVDRALNAIDKLTLDMNPMFVVNPRDELQVYDDGILIGIYVVEVIEVSEAAETSTRIRITAYHRVAQYIKMSAIYGWDYLQNVNFERSIELLRDVLISQWGPWLSSLFTVVNVDTTTMTSDPSTDIIDMLDGIEVLTEICRSHAINWRCTLTGVEVGVFGEQSQLVIRQPAGYIYHDAHTCTYNSASMIRDYTNYATDLFPEGGSYVNIYSNADRLTLYSRTNPPGISGAFELILKGDAHSRMMLSKKFDDNGDPFAFRRVQRIRIPSLIPKQINNGTNPPSDAEVEPYRQQLTDVAANYLNTYSKPFESWKVSISGSLSGRFDMGTISRVSLGFGLYNYTGSLFINKHVITYSENGVITSALELSNRFESIDTPLGEYWKQYIRADTLYAYLIVP